MKGQAISYTLEELDFIRSVCKWQRAEAHAAFCQKFRRDDVSLTNFNALSDDKANTDPSNWECIPRALLPRLVGGNRYTDRVAYDAAPPELKPTIMAVAKLEHRARLAKSTNPTKESDR